MIRDLKLALDLLTRGHKLIAMHLPAHYYPAVRGALADVIQALRDRIALFIKAQPPPP